MKTNLKQFIRASLSLGSLAAAALLVSGSVQTSQAASADPAAGDSFTWDLQSSGAGQKGVAVITFSTNLTFHGFQMWASTPPNTNSSGNGRGGDNLGRGDSSSSSGKVKNFLFGFSPITGTWAFNQKRQIVGIFSVAINVTSEVTNYLAGNIAETITNLQTLEITNIVVTFAPGQSIVTTNFAWENPPGFIQPYLLANTNLTVSVGSAETTNAISFTGTSSLGRRISLLCSTSFGKVVYKGKPAFVGPDLTGTWIGSRRANKQQFNEFFNLVSFSQGNPYPTEFPDIADFPNLYFTTNGVGPGYTFSGIVMLEQKKAGFTFVTDGGTLRSTLGPLKVSKKGTSSKTTGIEDPLSRITFDASLMGP